MTIYVLQVTGAVDDDGATRTWTFATHRIAGLPPGWSARILKPGNFERHGWGRASVTGEPQVDFGIARLNGRDGGLDELVLAGTDGREVLLWRGEEGSVVDAATGRRRDPTFAELELYLQGTVAGTSYDNGEVQLQLRNRQAELASLPVQDERYAGSNAGGAGREGTEDDLKDALKPIWLGWNENVPVPCVNRQRRIYQLSSASRVPVTGNAPAAVRDAGVLLTVTAVPTVEITGITAFEATGGPSSELWWHASAEGWYIRTESDPAGTVTVDAQEGTAADTTAAQLSARVLRAHGVAEGAIAGLTQLDAAAPEPIGIWTGLEERRIGEVLAALLSGAVATWTDDRTGVFTFGRLEVPAIAPDHVFTAAQLYRRGGGEGFRILAVTEPGSPLPISEAVALYRRNWQVQTDDDLAGGATPDFRAFAQLEHRKAAADNAAVLRKHRLARPYERSTLYTTAAKAAVATSRYVDLFGERRFFVEVDLPTALGAAVRMLQTVGIPIGRFDFDTRNFRVVGIVDDLDAQTEASVTTLILWG